MVFCEDGLKVIEFLMYKEKIITQTISRYVDDKGARRGFTKQ